MFTFTDRQTDRDRQSKMQSIYVYIAYIFAPSVNKYSEHKLCLRSSRKKEKSIQKKKWRVVECYDFVAVLVPGLG